MEMMSTFLGLVSKTEGRDKVLRLFQYLCLHSVDHSQKGSKFRVYQQMRMTRKMLRFLRTLDFLYKVIAQISQVKVNAKNLPLLLRHLTNIFQNFFTLLFYISDHRVCLSQLDVLSPQTHQVQYPRSMKFFLLQNIFGILNNIFCMVVSAQQCIKDNDKDFKKLMKAIKHYSFDMIRCFLDCFVALYYWKKIFSAKIAGVIGVLSTVIGIMQSLEKM